MIHQNKYWHKNLVGQRLNPGTSPITSKSISLENLLPQMPTKPLLPLPLNSVPAAADHPHREPGKGHFQLRLASEGSYRQVGHKEGIYDTEWANGLIKTFLIIYS